MDFDDYESYAPIRPDPPTSTTPPPSRLHRFRAPVMVLGVLALTFVIAPLAGTEESQDRHGRGTGHLIRVPDSSPFPTTTTLMPAIPAGHDTRVTRVIDGGTIEVAGGTRTRFIGIDAPETTSSRACFGSEASAETRRMLPADQGVRLVYDVDRLDSFGRTLAYVYTLPDGRFLNLDLARDGFAAQATFPPNVAHAEEFTRAVADARNVDRGLWAACPSAARVPLVSAPTATTSTTLAPLPARGASGTVPTTRPPAPVKPSGAGAAYYANCTAARAAGTAPLHRGDAGYRSALDRDGDGVACE